MVSNNVSRDLHVGALALADRAPIDWWLHEEDVHGRSDVHRLLCRQYNWVCGSFPSNCFEDTHRLAISSPHFLIDSEAPRYTTGTTAMFIGYIIKTVCHLALGAYMLWSNIKVRSLPQRVR